MEDTCKCGRSIRHMGRCIARREPRRSFVKGVPPSQATEPVPLLPDPLGRAISVEIGTVVLTLCPRCKGPKAHSPYAVCRTCMGAESLRAEREKGVHRPLVDSI